MIVQSGGRGTHTRVEIPVVLYSIFKILSGRKNTPIYMEFEAPFYEPFSRFFGKINRKFTIQGEISTISARMSIALTFLLCSKGAKNILYYMHFLPPFCKHFLRFSRKLTESLQLGAKIKILPCYFLQNRYVNSS
jgi:hypothetical protein